MSLLKVNEIQIFNGTTVTITATTTETSADLNVGADLDVTGALTLGTALAIAEGGTGATDAATARTNLDVDQAGTDNSTDVSLVTTSHDYLGIAGQAITLGPIDLAADVTGSLPYASISGTPTLGTAAAEDVGYFATAAQGSLADSAVQPGDDADTLGSGSATDGYVLTADGAGGAAWEAASGGGASLPIDLLSSGASIRKSDGTTAVLSESSGTVTLENASLGDTVLMPDNSNNVSTAPGIRFEADTDTGIGLASAGNLAVVTGGSERLRIDSSGNVGIGTSSPGSFNSAGRPLVIGSGSSNTGVTIYSGSASFGSLHFADGTSGGASFAGYINYNHSTNSMQFGTNGTVRMSIDSSGNIGAPSGTNIYNASDQRLKQNITDLSGCLQKVLLMRGVSFNWIDGFCDSEADKNLYGLIAQELQTVDSNLVDSFSDNTITVGGVTVENPLRVNEKFIIPMLVESIKEQQAIIEALETRIAALEA